MSNGSKGPHHSATPQSSEALDLTKLHASTAARDATASPNALADLTQASINSADVTRLSRRPEQRQDLSRLASAIRAQETARKSGKETESRTTRNSSTRYGVFTNPFYRYEGGPIGRLIALLANIMKALEQVLSQSPETLPQSHQPTALKKRKKSLSTSAEEEELTIEHSDSREHAKSPEHEGLVVATKIE